MNQLVRRVTPVALMALGLLAAPTAFAVTNVISVADFTGPNGNVGYNTKSYSFGTVSSLNGYNFSKKTIAGVQNLGASPGIPGEFSLTQGTDQGMLVTYLTPQNVQSIALGFLYPKEVFSDTHNEAVNITFNGTTTYTLTATGTTSFVWTGGGAVTNLSPAKGGGAGQWQITNPFAGSVTSILLSPFDTGAGRNFTNSDFGVNSIVSAVPEPITLLLLGSGMAFVMFRKRLRDC